jgi:hypothetical protein
VGQFDRDLTCCCIGSTCHKFLWWCPNFKVRVFFYSFFRRYTVRSILFRIFLTQGRPKNQTAQDLVLGPPKYFLFYKGIRSQKNSLNYIYIYLGLRFEHNKPSNSVGLVLACDREDAGLSHGTHVFFHL